jgi:cysteine desulfurase/selenocysteine lyase
VSKSAFDVAAVRAQFPALSRVVNGHPLAYLDSASTTQKPRAVIDVMTRALEATANIHRGVHTLSVEATEAYEAVRAKVARLINAKDPHEIVFCRGTTEAVNLVAQAWGRANVKAGDAIVITELEHHSNLVPWQMLCAERGARLVALPINERGEVDLESLDRALADRVRLVAIAHVSNALGTVLPVAEITRRAHAAGALVLVDGAQAVAHAPVDVLALGCDFYAFSGHKLYAPTGAGALWARREILEAMPPWQGGGDMILSVSIASTTYNEVPYKLEAGTPDILGVIGLGAAIDWLSSIGLANVAAREAELLAYATRALADVEGVRLIGTPTHRAGVVSFLLDDLHPHDVGTALDLEGIAVRTGHHCAEPAMHRLGLDGTVRASFGVYSTEEEIDRLALGLARARLLFGGHA